MEYNAAEVDWMFNSNKILKHKGTHYWVMYKEYNMSTAYKDISANPKFYSPHVQCPAELSFDIWSPK